MAIRDYNFLTGPTTETLPTATTPSASTDLVTYGFVISLTGTRASPSAIVAGSGVAFTGASIFNVWFIQGSGGAVDVSANPQIAAGTTAGKQFLLLIGRSDTNTVKLEDGTGLSLNGVCFLGADQMLLLIWDGTNWSEVSRSV